MSNEPCHEEMQRTCFDMASMNSLQKIEISEEGFSIVTAWDKGYVLKHAGDGRTQDLSIHLLSWTRRLASDIPLNPNVSAFGFVGSILLANHKDHIRSIRFNKYIAILKIFKYCILIFYFFGAKLPEDLAACCLAAFFSASIAEVTVKRCGCQWRSEDRAV